MTPKGGVASTFRVLPVDNVPAQLSSAHTEKINTSKHAGRDSLIFHACTLSTRPLQAAVTRKETGSTSDGNGDDDPSKDKSTKSRKRETEDHGEGSDREGAGPSLGCRSNKRIRTGFEGTSGVEY